VGRRGEPDHELPPRRLLHERYGGTAVGDGGVILRTADGGLTWNAQTSGTSRQLAAVFLVNESVGMAVGTARSCGPWMVRCQPGATIGDSSTSSSVPTGIDSHCPASVSGIIEMLVIACARVSSGPRAAPLCPSNADAR